ncbi:MAG: DinB family protein [Acidimicrobiia bacterium]
MSIRTFYDMWPQYNERITRVIADMSTEQLGVRPEPDGWPVWATVGHTAGGRVYWLCSVIGEPGAEETPFTDPEGLGWEDDLDTPRGPDELAHALDSTFSIVDRCLDRWDEDMMGDVIVREFAGHRQLHSRGSILQRLFSHDSYHAGELSQTLGMHGLAQIDLWAAD